MQPILNRRPLALAAAGLTLTAVAAVAAAPAAADTLLETFDGDTLATTDLTLLDRDADGSTTFAIVNQAAGDDALQILLDSSETARAQVADATPFDSFLVSADVSPTTFDFTSGAVGVFALGGPQPTVIEGNDAGYHVQVRNDGFNGDTYVLRLFDDNVALATSAAFDLSAGSNLTSFNLALAGALQPGGDLLLTATFTPDAADNPNGLAPIVLSETIAAGDVESKSSLFGVRQSIFGNNDLDVTYDNVVVDVTAVPEPASLGVLGLAGLALRRRR